MAIFNIYPLGKNYPITVEGNKSSYLRALNMGTYSVHHFKVIDISKTTALLLCRNADDRCANTRGWHAHCRGKFQDYVYYKTCRGRFISLCTYRKTL